MSLNDIKMPPQLIVGLYADTLVETEIIANEEQPAREQEQKEQPVRETPVRAMPLMEEPKIEQPPILQPVMEQPLMPGALVEEPVIELKPPTEQRRFDFQGKNKKHIVILSTSDKAQYLPEAELKFLISVLKACGLTTEDVAILNLKNQTADHAGLQSFFQCRGALLFGIEPQQIDLPMNFPQFQLQHFNKCTYLHAPALLEIEKEKELKMKLWVCLKNLFSL